MAHGGDDGYDEYDRHFDDYDDEYEARPRPRRRGLRILGVSAALLALLVVGAGAAYLAFLNHTVSSNVAHDDLLPGPGPVTGEDGQETPQPQLEQPEEAGDALNFLLLGSDSRSADPEGGRSDVIVLMHISDDREQVHLIHFPRDLYVDIPGHGEDKINAAYAYGGPQLVVSALQPLIGVPVDHVALIDFEGFKSMTDAVGGVDVDVAEASPGFSVGTQHMNGERALEFVRERKALSQGDISRGQRQQAFIKGLMIKGTSSDTLTNPVTLANFVDAATANLTVDQNLSVGDMRGLAFDMRGLRSGDVAFITAPWSGLGTAPDGGSIVLTDEAQMDRLAEALQTDDLAGYEDLSSPSQGF